MLLQTNFNPSDRQLRQFGVACLFALPLIAWMWGGEMTTIYVCAAIGATIAATSFALPQLIKPLFVAICFVTLPIGLVVSEVLVATIYFGLFLPMALTFRLIRRDGLQRNIERDRETYWEDKAQPSGPASYYHQW